MTSPISGSSKSSARFSESASTQTAKKSNLSDIETLSENISTSHAVFSDQSLRSVIVSFNDSGELFRIRETSKIFKQSADASDVHIDVLLNNLRVQVPASQLNKTILFKKLFKAPSPQQQPPLSPLDQAAFSEFLRINPDLIKSITAGECEAESHCTQIKDKHIELGWRAQNAQITGLQKTTEDDLYPIAFVQATVNDDSLVIAGSIKLAQPHELNGAISIFRADPENQSSSYWFFSLNKFNLPHYLQTGEFANESKGIKQTIFTNLNQTEEWHGVIFDAEGDLEAGTIKCKKVIANAIKYEWHGVSIDDNGTIQADSKGDYLRINATDGTVLAYRKDVVFEENGRIRENNAA